MWQKIEVLISKSKILLNSIENNLPKSCYVQIFHLTPDNQEMLLSIPKIDTLILDEPLDSNIPLYKINNVINLTNKQLTSNDIFLQKPVRLNELLNIVHLARVKDLIFCLLNDHVYDEQMGRLLDQTSATRLTEKENEIIKYLLVAIDNKISKDELFDKAWNYNFKSNSTTFETHMSRLKQKLPQDLLQSKDNYYKLSITNLV